jgi:hypothetical protein
VSLSARLAIESPQITTDVINVAVLPYLAIRYAVENIPTIVVNRRKACVGPVTEEDFVRAILAARPSREE